MAGPFCALWAQGRRAAAHSGGPRPSCPASASLRPRSGRGPAGGPLGPGLGPALPTRRPRGLVLLTARQGIPALRAGGGSRPRPLGASLPPPAACGPLPLPTLGGLGAARPARLRRSGSCGGWSPPSAAQVCAPAGLASRQPLRGATQSGRKAKPPSGAASRALPPASPAPVAASVLRAAPPPLVGAFGAVRPSGPGVPGSGQPPRAGPPAALPALARLCLR